MQRLMISMNIASNGCATAPETLLELRRRVRDLSCCAETELDYHRQLWRLSGFDSYQFTLSARSARQADLDVRVRVVNGAVACAHRLEDPSTPVRLPEVGTVEDYFQWIEQALQHRTKGTRVHYHPLYGYPLCFTLDEAHAGHRAEARQFA